MNTKDEGIVEQARGLLEFFQRKPELKAWHIILLGEVIGEKIKELRPPAETPAPVLEMPKLELPEFPKPVDLAKEFAKRVPRPRQPKTKSFYRKNLPVEHSYDVVKTNVMGSLREFAVKSPSDNFMVLMLTDGVVRVSDWYSDLADHSSISEWIDAYQDAVDNEYVVRIGPTSWTEKCLLTVRVKAPVKLSKVIAVWDELVEI